MKKYRILPGQSFLQDGSAFGPGSVIELDDDTAREHAHRIQPITDGSDGPAARGSASEPVARPVGLVTR